MYFLENFDIIIPDIPAVTPVYNAECYISQCVDSILIQLFTDYAILVDDGSEDEVFAF